MLKIENITREAFAKYGTVLEFTKENDNEIFEILVTEKEHPWRLAVFRVPNKSVEKLESHPSSFESFEPVSGTGILLVATQAAPQEPKAFLLDRPICLHKGIWHAMLTLSEQAIVKIAENAEVESVLFPLNDPLTAQIV